MYNDCESCNLGLTESRTIFQSLDLNLCDVGTLSCGEFLRPF